MLNFKGMRFPTDVILEKWPRLFGQNLLILKWCLADVGLSTARLAAPFAEQERAARWVTRSSIYAACCNAGRC